MFAIVESGNVTSTMETPRRVRIGNRVYGPSDFCTPGGIAAGIFPMVMVTPADHDPVTQTLTGPSYHVDADRVRAVYASQDLPLAASRSSAARAIKHWRDAREFDPFEFEGVWVKGDATSQRRIGVAVAAAQAAAAASEPYTNAWVGLGGRVIEIANAGQMLALQSAQAAQFAQVFSGSVTALQDAADAETTADARAVVAAFRAAYPAIVPLSSAEYADHVRMVQAGRPSDPTKRYVDIGV